MNPKLTDEPIALMKDSGRSSRWLRPLLSLAATGAFVAALLLLLLQPSQAAERPLAPEQFPLNPTPTPVGNFFLLTRPPDASTVLSDTDGIEGLTPPQVYVVQMGDTLLKVSLEYGVPIDAIVKLNNIADENRIEIGQVIIIPNQSGQAPPLPSTPAGMLPGQVVSITQSLSRTNILSRLTQSAQQTPLTSPFYKTTWVAYYGRPNTPVMGIIGEHDVATVTDILKDHARKVDIANGPDLRARAAYHLVYGMATIAEGDDGSHLAYLDDAIVMEYITQGLKDNVAVILDIQMGALSATQAISPALKFLKFPNVHLALDPEFAMTSAGQKTPGNPIGYLTGEQINAAQEYVQKYLDENKIRGRRILLIHQFFDAMIRNKEVIDWENPKLELAIVADGFGDPWGKITKYNQFFPADTPVKYTGFKIFNRWDNPVLTDSQALGEEKYSQNLFMDVAPNIIIWQ